MAPVAKLDKSQFVQGLKDSGHLPGWLDPTGDLSWSETDDGKLLFESTQEAPTEVPAEDS